MNVKKIFIKSQQLYGLVVEIQEHKGLYGFSVYTSYNAGGFGKLITDEEFKYKSLYDVKVAIRSEAKKVIKKGFRNNKKMLDELNTKLEKI